MVNRQIRFPVELWVAICGLLPPKDQHSLAESCKRLFSIVHLNPPPTVVKIDNRRLRSTEWERKDLLHLRSATELHWSGSRHDSVESLRLHTVISVLSIIPNIRLLSLRHTNVNEGQQAIIFGLSTLRTLVVNFCYFYPWTNPIPCSHVTSLKLVRTAMETTRSLLTIFATTVEDLDVDVYAARNVHQGGLIKFPKLSTFTMNHSAVTSGQTMLNTLKRYTSITTLHISSLSDVSFHHSDLPALHSLTCCYRLALNLIPERPVTTYVEVYPDLEEEPLRLLDALSKTRPGITDLKLFVPNNICSLLPPLATSLQHLEQLTIKLCSPVKVDPSPNHLSGKPLHNLSGARTVVLPKLKRVTIWVDGYENTGFSLAEWLLKECFIPVSPVLEEFKYLYFAGFISAFQLYRPPEPTRAWRVRRLTDGSWERQGPPPIPTSTPTPASTLGAAP